MDIIEHVLKKVGMPYVWGGQGEKGLTDEQIISMERGNKQQAARVIKFINDKRKKLEFFDCSGLITTYMLSRGYITRDTTADGLYRRCDKIKGEPKNGDFTFRINSNGKAYHIGVYHNGYVTHAKGRDDGVVTEKYNNKFWNDIRRHPKIKNEKGLNEVILSDTGKPYQYNYSIELLQSALYMLGYDIGTVDGKCGQKTMDAVKRFCLKNGG